MQVSLFIIALLCLGILVSCSTHTSQETTAEEKLRVQINATEDTITLRFIRPHANADTHAPRLQLEGYLLGYGGSMFSKQYIELPQDGTPYYAEMDAEPKYLISVEPVKPHVEKKKACPNKVDLKKPLHLVIGSITDTKVLLSWGTILNTPYTQQDADCPEDSQYTIRYREKDPESTPAPTAAPTTPSPPGRERQWNYQSCPSSTTVVDKLKPDTPYEFEVRTDTDPKGPSGEWSGPVVHNTNASVTETIVTLMENSNKEIEKPFKPPVVPIIPHAKETKPDALPTWALPTAFTPITIPPPQSHTHTHINPPITTHPPHINQPTTTISTNKQKAPGQESKTTDASSTTTRPAKHIPHRHRHRKPHLDTTYRPNTRVRKPHLDATYRPNIRVRKPHLDAKHRPSTSNSTHTRPSTRGSTSQSNKVSTSGRTDGRIRTSGSTDVSTSSRTSISISTNASAPKAHAEGPASPALTVSQRPKPAAGSREGTSANNPKKHNPGAQRPDRHRPVARKPNANVRDGNIRDASIANTNITDSHRPETSIHEASRPDANIPDINSNGNIADTTKSDSLRVDTNIHSGNRPESKRSDASLHTQVGQSQSVTSVTRAPPPELTADGDEVQPAVSIVTEPVVLAGTATSLEGHVGNPNQKVVGKEGHPHKSASAVATASQVTEASTPLKPDAQQRSVERNTDPTNTGDGPITTREGFVFSVPGQSSHEENPAISDRQPIKTRHERPLKKPTKGSKPPAKKPNKANKPKPQGGKLKQSVTAGQKPIKHSQQTAPDGKETIKTGQRPSQGKQPMRAGPSPASSVTDWSRAQGHALTTPSTPFSLVQTHIPSSKHASPQNTHPTEEQTHTQRHTYGAEERTPLHKHTHQQNTLNTTQDIQPKTPPLPAQNQEDSEQTRKPTKPKSQNTHISSEVPIKLPLAPADPSRMTTPRVHSHSQAHTHVHIHTLHPQTTESPRRASGPVLAHHAPHSPAQASLTPSPARESSLLPESTQQLPEPPLGNLLCHLLPHTTISYRPALKFVMFIYCKQCLSICVSISSSSVKHLRSHRLCLLLSSCYKTSICLSHSYLPIIKPVYVYLAATSQSKDGKAVVNPALVSESPDNKGHGDRRRLPGQPRPDVSAGYPGYPGPAPANRRPRPPHHRNSTLSPRRPDVAVEGMQGVTLTKPAPKPRNGSSVLKPPPGPEKYNLNQVVEPEQKAEEKDKGPVDLKQVDPETAPKPTPSPTTRTSTNRTPPTTPTPNKTTQTTPEPTSQLPRTTPRITLAPPTTHSPPPQPQSTARSVQTPQPITSSAAPTPPTTRSTEPPKPAKRIPQPARPVYRNPGRPRPGKKIPEHPRLANGRTLRPRLTPPTTTTTTTLAPAPKTTPLANLNGGYIESTANSSVFSAVPTSEEDAMGNKRFIAPHVVYQTDKGPKEPCSITRTLSHFPDDEVTEVNVTAPPRNAPENVTVVAVEGCPSFVIIDWDKGDNETTEYEVTSSTKGPSGKEVSVLVTNKTHTAVENLNPESSYQFTVTPKNELGTGPSSEPVSFRTESVDPQVAEVTGKRAIWSTFPFKLDIQSECNGPQYIKRTWYRKFVGIQLCNSLRYKIYLSDSLRGPFYHIGDLSGHGEDHCQFVDSLLDGRTGSSIPANHLPETEGFYRAMRQEPVTFGTIGGNSHINYVSWYECGVSIPGKW
ncbi:target of Nesh-SH3 [Engraulis encrasicolus]|uniref:target of Nesh-SH3 n=1 Tax=Engraulis encrasicolus TaxID=184585 RepID=UPI002FCF9ABA